MALLNIETEKTLIEFGVAERAAGGQAASGDSYFIKQSPHNALVAVMDGAGHGSNALAAVNAARTVLEDEINTPLPDLMRLCHNALRRTRGAVMTLARLDAPRETVTWLGVGNVEGHLLRAGQSERFPSESVILRGGVVGYHLPALHQSVVHVAPGDVLVFATDGVRAGFAEDISTAGFPQRLAERIMSKHFKGNDDALVLVVRFLGL